MSEIEDPRTTSTEPAPGSEEDAAQQDDLALPADLAADSLSDYFRASYSRIKAGESGVLPVVCGLILVSVLFQSMNRTFL